MSRFDTIAAEGDPFKLVAFIPLGSRLSRMTSRGGVRLYWVARKPLPPGGKSERVYVGSDANKAVLEAAWAAVQAEITKAEATPEGRRLRELQELAGGPSLARTSVGDDVVDVFDMATLGRGGTRRPKR